MAYMVIFFIIFISFNNQMLPPDWLLKNIGGSIIWLLEMKIEEDIDHVRIPFFFFMCSHLKIPSTIILKRQRLIVDGISLTCEHMKKKGFPFHPY